MTAALNQLLLRTLAFAVTSVVLIHLLLPSFAISDEHLNEQAYEVLRTRCYRCHGGAAKQAGLDVLSRDVLLKPRSTTEDSVAFVVAGQPDESFLLAAISGEGSYMPPASSPESKEITAEEKELLVKWVAAGAEFPKVEGRKFVDKKQTLAAMRTYLLKLNLEERKQVRFYTLTHLVNNPNVSELDLRLYRAAFAKAVNSLSRERELYQPVLLPESGDSVFAVHLNAVGWDQGNLWAKIIAKYPYALKYDYVLDMEVRDLWTEIVSYTGADMPEIRADWFIVTATRPPLYHELLDIPASLTALEFQFELDTASNFVNKKVARAGFAKSGVSQQNRLLERHTTRITSYVWMSYDFLPRNAKGDLVRLPLGPTFETNPFKNLAFKHDGGEIIWSLPNGLQGYMLVDGKGERIDQGPVEVVFDRSGLLGNPTIVNGISCIACHREGMITDFRDEIRNSQAVAGLAQQRVMDIYPPNDEMQKLIGKDRDRFLAAVEEVCGPYLKVGKDKDKSISDFPEPIGKVAEMYARDLTPTEVALELGIQDVKTFCQNITANRNMLKLGLGTLAQEPPGTFKREKWEAREATSLMQDTASELRLGVPFVAPPTK